MTALLREGAKVTLGTRTYTVATVIGRGGSGEVYKVQHRGRNFALKVFFPFFELGQSAPGNAPEFVRRSVDFQKREFHFISELSHPNIVRVHDDGDISLSPSQRKSLGISGIESLPAIVTEFVDGLPLLTAIKEYHLSAENVADVLLRCAAAIEYLHAERTYMHTDIKSANILVRKADHQPVLIDFALCKNLNFAEVARDEVTALLGDWDLFPKALPTEHELRRIKETEGTRERLYELAFPALDLFQFGKLLKTLLSGYRRVFEDRDGLYLDMLADQLTDWNQVTTWGTRDLVPRVARVAAEHFAPFGVPELAAPTSTERTITLPQGVTIPVTPILQRLLNNRSFRRLASIQQLSLLSHVYPAADYKRQVHVLFAYDLARQFVLQLYSSPLFRALFDKTRSQQLLVCALMHDINHFPFLHIFQESGIPGLDQLGIVDLFCEGDATGEKSLKQPSVYELMSSLGLEPDRFKRIVFQKHHEQSGKLKEVDQTISSVISSGVDVDKLSYLTLDSYFSGVRYGSGVDFGAILKAVRLIRLSTGDHGPHVAFTDRALQALENVVMTRFWQFRSLYWHHTNRAIMSMILDVTRRLYIDKKRDFRDFLLDTMWVSDLDAIRQLDITYRKDFGRDSILKHLIPDRTAIYRRLYTVRAGMGDEFDDSLYKECKDFTWRDERRLRENVAAGLQDYLRRGGHEIAIGEEDVLVDVPRREMDTGGSAYVIGPSDEAQPLSYISDPVRSINGNYDRLTKRVRFFVAPHVSTLVTKSFRTANRATIQEIIREALQSTKKKSEVV